MSAADRQPFIVDQQSSAAAAAAAAASTTTSSGTRSHTDDSVTSTPNRGQQQQQPIRMVLKLAQSGGYSPADLNHSTTTTTTAAAASSSADSNGQHQLRPPTLLPLHDDDDDDEEEDCEGTGDLYSGNGSMSRRSKKKKKKKHHHHHHHHHHHRHHNRESGGAENHHHQQQNETTTAMMGGDAMTTAATASTSSSMLDMADDSAFDAGNHSTNLSDGVRINSGEAATFSGALQQSVLKSATLNSLAALRDSDVFGDEEEEEDEEDEEEEEEDELGNGLNDRDHHLHRRKPSNKSILNLIGSDQLGLLDGSPHDSIASVDLMDVDSNNLDISCFQATGDSPEEEGEDVNSPSDLLGSSRQLQRQPSSQSSSSAGGGKEQQQLKNSTTENNHHHHHPHHLNNNSSSNSNHLSSLTSKSAAAAADAPLQSSSTTSLYRRLLQQGITIDSSNVIAYVQTVGGRPTTKRAKAWVAFAGELLRRLQEKDSRHFFAWPTTELTAPGYSAVVAHPMDWATIEKKITFCLYRSIYEMKVDVRVLCENALRYYRSSGAQYREAARLWAFAKRAVFTRETFTELLPQFPPLTLDDLGLEVLIGEKVNRRRKKKRRKTNSKTAAAATAAAAVNGFSGLSSLLNSSCASGGNLPVKKETMVTALEAVEEEEENESSEQPWSKEEILRAAAKALGQEETELKLEEAEARWSLEPRRKVVKKSHHHQQQHHHLSNGHQHHPLQPPPPAPVLLTRQRPDGSTSLPFVLPPSSAADPEDPEAAVNTIGALVGRLSEGTRSVPVTSEAEYNRVRVMQLLPEAFTLPFSSHLPLLGATAGGSGAGGGGGGGGGRRGGGSSTGSGTVLNLEDSSLLLNEFGDCEEQFRETIQRISEDVDYTAIGFVDSVLDIVSGGRYSKERQQEREKETSKTTSAVEEKEVPMEVDDRAETAAASAAAEEVTDNQQHEEVEMIKEEEEVSGVENSEQAQLQQALDEAQTLISELEAMQYRRLASAPEPVPPDERETELAEAVTSKLVSIIATSARPQDVVSLQAIRRSMGVMVQDVDEVEGEVEEVVDVQGQQTSETEQPLPAAASAAEQQSQPSI